MLGVGFYPNNELIVINEEVSIVKTVKYVCYDVKNETFVYLWWPVFGRSQAGTAKILLGIFRIFVEIVWKLEQKFRTCPGETGRLVTIVYWLWEELSLELTC